MLLQIYVFQITKAIHNRTPDGLLFISLLQIYVFQITKAIHNVLCTALFLGGAVTNICLSNNKSNSQHEYEIPALKEAVTNICLSNNKSNSQLCLWGKYSDRGCYKYMSFK